MRDAVPGPEPLGQVDEGRDLLGVRDVERVGLVGGRPLPVAGMRVRPRARRARWTPAGSRGPPRRRVPRGARPPRREDDPGGEPPAAVVDDAHGEADVVGGDRGLEVEVLQREELAPRRDHPEGGVLGPELASARERGVGERGEWQGQELGVDSRHEGQPSEGRPVSPDGGSGRRRPRRTLRSRSAARPARWPTRRAGRRSEGCGPDRGDNPPIGAGGRGRMLQRGRAEARQPPARVPYAGDRSRAAGDDQPRARACLLGIARAPDGRQDRDESGDLLGGGVPADDPDHRRLCVAAHKVEPL